MTLKNIDNYDITIYNNQKIDNDTDIIEEKCTGSFRIKNGKSYIMYKAGQEGTKTSVTVIVSEDYVKIRRTGAVNSEMLYRTDRKTSFMYNLPYGSMSIDIETELIEAQLCDDGGEIRLVYVLIIQNERYYNDLKITVKKRYEE